LLTRRKSAVSAPPDEIDKLDRLKSGRRISDDEYQRLRGRLVG
jgi:hypothetical protein